MITDRKDYYHQLWTTDAHASANAVGPSVHKELVKDTNVYMAYALRSSLSRKHSRERYGDDLHSFAFHPGEGIDREPLPSDSLWASFGSVLQEDHAGVEIATAAHESWLQQYGLLQESTALQHHIVCDRGLFCRV